MSSVFCFIWKEMG